MSSQYLSDKEYEAVRRDMRTIISGIVIVDGDIDGDNDADYCYLEGEEETIAKLTAYVDQNIKFHVQINR